VRLHDGTSIQADVIVMNGDASMLMRLMKSPTDQGLPPEQRSMSGFLTLAGLPREVPGLHHHTVYFSADYEHEFRQLIDEARFPTDPTVYVNAPSRSDRSLVPGDGETLFIMANAPARSEPWDEAATVEARSRVFARLRASGFDAIDAELPVLEHWTPRRIEQAYRMPGGAIYGRHSHGWRGAFMRPANRQRTRGLYVVGGSGHPGGGTPTVLLSAKITSELISQHERD
jgi:phytoene dehydrogenase-like protein